MGAATPRSVSRPNTRHSVAKHNGQLTTFCPLRSRTDEWGGTLVTKLGSLGICRIARRTTQLQWGGALIAEFSPYRIFILALGTRHAVSFPLCRTPIPPDSGQSHTRPEESGPV